MFTKDLIEHSTAFWRNNDKSDDQLYSSSYPQSLPIENVLVPRIIPFIVIQSLIRYIFLSIEIVYSLLDEVPPRNETPDTSSISQDTRT